MSSSSAYLRAVFALLLGGSLAACAGGSAMTPLPTSMTRAAIRPQTVRETARGAQQAPAVVPKYCKLIDTVNPKSDFAGLGFTARRFEGGDHLDVDATGCTYGIYLSPASKNLHITNSTVNGAYRVPIFSEDVSNVSIENTVVNGPEDQNAAPSVIGIAFRGASGEVEDTKVFNTSSAGMNIVVNNSCFGVGNPMVPCRISDVQVERTTIDNSKSTGDGFVVGGGPFPNNVAIAKISHSTVIGSGLEDLPKTSQVDIYGAQVGYAFAVGKVDLDESSSINNQIGIDDYCSKVNNIDDQKDLSGEHDSVVFKKTDDLPEHPLDEDQVLNIFSAAQVNAVVPGTC